MTQLRDNIDVSDAAAMADDIDAVDLEYQQYKWDVLKQDRFKSDSKDRVWLAEWSTAVVSIWLFLVFMVLISNSNTLHLTESVMNMLLGTTTLNVLGLMYIVLRGHFNNKA